MTTKVDLRTNDTRERIIREAKRLYVTGGFSNLSMDKIAELLGLTRPSLYYHFPGGKEQLLVETLYLSLSEQLTVWRRAISNGHDTRSRLRNILGTAIDYPLPENKWSLVIELWQLGDEVKKVLKQSFEKHFHMLSQIFIEGVEKGEIRKVEIEFAAHSFLAIFDQVENIIATRRYFPDLLSCVHKYNQEELIDKIFEFWMSGMEVRALNNT